MISSVHDLIPGQECFVCLIKNGKTFKSIYLGCVKTPADPDFYFRYLEKTGFKGTTSYFGIQEIGVGRTREEAKANYGKLKIELPQQHFDNPDEIPGREKIPV